MRFNQQHRYNVPYGHKDDRFSKAYITKIVNQLEYVQRKIAENDWKFAARRYEDAIATAPSNSFIYCDPPYIGLTAPITTLGTRKRRKGCTTHSW